MSNRPTKKRILTLEQMLKQADQFGDVYTALQQKIFYILIDGFKRLRPMLIEAEDDPQKILEWRLAALSQMGGLTDKIIKFVSKQTGESERAIYQIIQQNGIRVTKQMNRQLSRTLKKPVHDVNQNTMNIVSSYAAQTFREINNQVNQSLLSRNYRRNPALRTYQRIVNKTVLDVSVGKKTARKALNDSLGQMYNNGMGLTITDRAGNQRSVESYVRTTMNTTVARTYNDARMSSMKDYDTVLAVMTSHPAARPACSEIQGQVVCVVSTFDDRYVDGYPSIYDYGYGEPSGCFGINCGHSLIPYVEGVTTNTQKRYDPEKAVANEKIRNKQRYMQRQIRNKKMQLALAKHAGDDEKATQIRSSIRGYQGKVRKIVNDHGFLARERSYEQVSSATIQKVLDDSDAENS